MIAVALGMVVIFSLAAFFHEELSRQAISDVHRSQLASVARLQGQSALDEMLGQFAWDANRWGNALYGALRWQLDDSWTEIDLKPWMKPPRERVIPRWGKRNSSVGGHGDSQILDHWVKLRFPRASQDLDGSEERVFVLTLGVLVESSDASGTVRKKLEASYEVRSILIAPPRPFDQLGLYLGDLGAVMDTQAVNRVREKAIIRHEELRSELEAYDTTGLSGEDRQWFEQIKQGMLSERELRQRVPRFPEKPACLLGFGPEVQEVPLEGLSLMKTLQAYEQKLETLRASLGPGTAADRPRLEFAYEMVDEFSNIFDSLWQMGEWVTQPVSKDSTRFTQDIQPYLKRLTPSHFLDRVTTVPGEEEPFFHWWRARGLHLEGVLDLTHWTRRVELEGELQGRVILLVGAGGVRLKDLNWNAARFHHRMIVVSLGGDVRIEGKVHASVIMLPREDGGSHVGSLQMGLDTRLQGSLILPYASAGNLSLQGKLEYDRLMRTAYPPQRTMNRATRGEYLFALGTRPLWMKEEAP
jgi:hypothetical protein